MRSILIICTKDRPAEVIGLLECLQDVNPSLDVVIIVDSSESVDTKMQINHYCKKSPLAIVLLSSLPGLPHQRNVAIEWIRKNHPIVDLIFFLDDDARVSARYFEVAEEFVRQNGDWLGITGVNSSIQYSKPKVLRRIFLLDSKKSGRLLPSGETTPPNPIQAIEEVDWMPGISMVLNPKVFQQIEFNSELRMYYEDVDFSIKLRKLGPIFCLREMSYSHLSVSTGRKSPEQIIAFTYGMKWQLSNVSQSRITKRAIIWSMIGMSLNSLAMLLVNTKREDAKSRLLGQLIFLSRLLKNKDVVEKINHDFDLEKGEKTR
jgi:GT2 family glycosyltransferase